MVPVLLTGTGGYHLQQYITLTPLIKAVALLKLLLWVRVGYKMCLVIN